MWGTGRARSCSGQCSVVDDDQLGDPLLPEAEVEAQNQRVGQSAFIVGTVGARVDGDVAVAIYGPQGRECDAVAEDFFRRESADRLGPGEFSLDVVDQGIRGESRHPGIDIVAVAGSEVASDGWRQIVGYIAGHGLAPSHWGKKWLAPPGHPAGWRAQTALPHLGLTAIGAALRTVSPMMRSAAQRSAVAVGCIRPIHFI